MGGTVFCKEAQRNCEQAANKATGRGQQGRRTASEEQQKRQEEEKHICAEKRRSSQRYPALVNKALKKSSLGHV